MAACGTSIGSQTKLFHSPISVHMCMQSSPGSSGWPGDQFVYVTGKPENSHIKVPSV